jgi:hypothetical protein
MCYIYLSIYLSIWICIYISVVFRNFLEGYFGRQRWGERWHSEVRTYTSWKVQDVFGTIALMTLAGGLHPCRRGRWHRALESRTRW